MKNFSLAGIEVFCRGNGGAFRKKVVFCR
jgi:hypothetical protein